MSFDQNQDIKGEKKPSAPAEEATPQTTSSNYEDFGTSGGDTILEMPVVDPDAVKPDNAAEAEAPVSDETLAWLSGDEPPPAEPQNIGATLEMPKLSLVDEVKQAEPTEPPTPTAETPQEPEAATPPAEPQQAAPAEAEEPPSHTTIPEPIEAPQATEEPQTAEAPEAPEAAQPVAAAEASDSNEAPHSETPQANEEPKQFDNTEDSLELVEEIKADSEEGDDTDLSEQIGWSTGLPEKQEATPPPPLPKAPPPTPKSPPPPVPSGPQKAVSNPNNNRVDGPKKPISKLDLPPELFEEDPPTKNVEALQSPTPTLQLPKMLPKGWWDTIFNEDFLRTNPAKSEAMTRKESDFIEQCLVPKPGDSILDVACGYGRHVIEMASRNYNMVGLDLSLPYLMLAAEISTRRKLMANFIHGDMRDLQFKEYFDHAYCTFTSFGYFDDDTNLETLRGVYRSLKPKGRFLLEVINRDFAVSACPLRGWWEGIGCVMLEETEFNYSSSMLTTKRSVIFEDGRQAMQETHVRLYSLHELTAMYKAAGFKILEVSGGVDLRGVFFGADSTHLIILAEKQR